MLTEAERQQCAEMLYAAEVQRSPAPRPSETYAGMDLADAYAVQRLGADMHLAAGARRIGHKIGLTSRTMQAATGATEPDYGVLLDTKAHSNGARLAIDDFLTPRIEMEIAFILRDDLSGRHLGVADVLRATEYVLPALEIIDSRTAAPRPVIDAVADNAGLGAIVTGGRVMRPFDIDVQRIAATLSRNGVIEESGVSAAVLGHPAAGIAWLAGALDRFGEKLSRGDIVLSGSFIRPVIIERGDVAHADFGSAGTITVSFN